MLRVKWSESGSILILALNQCPFSVGNSQSTVKQVKYIKFDICGRGF